MSDSVPYLGSKISLISKSEIRYEGILYTIDAQESIIALARVQSFGTEDRPTAMPVPAKSDIYEYIIFRGADIKKIEVCETPKQLQSFHNDPAIVGLQHSNPAVASLSPAASSFNHQPLGPIGSVGGTYYGNFGQQLGHQNMPSSGFSIANQPSELSSGMGSSVGGVSVDAQSATGSSQPIPAPIGTLPQSGITSHSNQQVDVLAGSRSSTPGASRKSPVADAGVQVTPPSPPQQQQQQQTEKKRVNQSSSQRPQYVSERHNREGLGNNQIRRPQGGNYYQQGQGNQYQGTRQQYQGYYQSGQQYQGQFRGMGRGRAPRRLQSRGRGVFNQGSRQRQDQQLFEKEFDFEQANVQFEELRTQLAKTKITENGDKKDEKKEDSGHETATTGDESEDSSSSTYYDKTKSFFDTISCEAIERSKGKSQRSDWRQERKINVQTFGVATSRRGSYQRGRGGYYSRGGYYNRGGYYRNYNQAYYRGNGNSNYRGRAAGSSTNGGGTNPGNPNRNSNVNGDSIGNGDDAIGGSNSYASAVRTSVVAK